MRRSDREIRDIGEISELISRCDTLRLGFCDGAVPYIVPLSFGYEKIEGGFAFYIHGAKHGRRHELAAKCGTVCVELDMCCGFRYLGTEEQTCDYKSFIGEGRIEQLAGADARRALELICLHCGSEGMTCSDTVVSNTCTEKITVTKFTAKQRFEPTT